MCKLRWLSRNDPVLVEGWKECAAKATHHLLYTAQPRHIPKPTPESGLEETYRVLRKYRTDAREHNDTKSGSNAAVILPWSYSVLQDDT